MKTSLFIVLIAGMTAFALPAQSADTMDVAAPAAYNWSGLYAGVSGGYGWGDFRQGWTAATYRGLGTYAGDADSTLSGNGGLFGANLGYNRQIDKFVFGLEADVSYTGMTARGEAVDGDIWTPGDSFVETWNADLDWLATLRGRAGMALDRVFVYGTAGLAIGGGSDKTWFDYRDGAGSGLSGVNKDREVHVGWAAGVGVETAITQKLTAKLEYLHADLGEATYMGNRGNLVLNYADASITADIVRVGLNYRF